MSLIPWNERGRDNKKCPLVGSKMFFRHNYFYFCMYSGFWIYVGFILFCEHAVYLVIEALSIQNVVHIISIIRVLLDT